MCPSQCPICAQHVYKLGHDLYTRATAWPLLVHWSYCLDTPCTLELLLGHSLYTALVLLGHSLCRSCATSLGTACILEVYCLGTLGTLYRATCLPTTFPLAWASLVHHLQLCTFEYKMWWLKDSNKITTVKPPNRGHFGDGPFVPCREVVLFSEVLF